MGKWFVQYFLQNQNKVFAYDLKKSTLRKSGLPNLLVSSNVEDCVSTADYVFLSTPTDKMPEEIRKTSKYMKNDAVLVEISSIKKTVFPALRMIKASVRPVSLHPMFGPNASKKAPRMLLIPVREKDREMEAIRKLFSDATILLMPSPKAHDRVMGLVLGLTYFINLALAKTISNDDLELLKRVAGTTFSVQMTVTESVLGEDPQLIETVISRNPETQAWIRSYLKSAAILAKQSNEKGSIRNTSQALSSKMRKTADLAGSNEKLYRIISLGKKGVGKPIEW